MPPAAAATTPACSYRPCTTRPSSQPTLALQNAFENRPYNDPQPPRLSPPKNAILPAQRNDFLFGTAQEALYAQLGARLNNPGWHTSIVSGAPPEQYHPFSLSDSMA